MSILEKQPNSCWNLQKTRQGFLSRPQMTARSTRKSAIPIAGKQHYPPENGCITILSGASAFRPPAWPCTPHSSAHVLRIPFGPGVARMRLCSAFPVCRRALLRIQASGLARKNAERRSRPVLRIHKAGRSPDAEEDEEKEKENEEEECGEHELQQWPAIPLLELSPSRITGLFIPKRLQSVIVITPLFFHFHP